MNCPMDILHEFPIRKNKQQKTAFLEEVTTYCVSLGYKTEIEKGSFNLRNLVIGDPEKAKYLVTAHYDTCPMLPFPNLITPCNLALFIAWQLFLVIVLCVPIGVLAGVAAYLLDLPEFTALIAYFLLLAELFLILFGPANRTNANDNTSGVIAVLELAKAMPELERDNVAFVLFDLEETGLWGSMDYRKKHRTQTNRQLIFNLDCVGDGDEILFFPTRKLKADRKRIDAILDVLAETEDKTLVVKDKGFSIYPSDQANFPYGFGIAAFLRSSWAGLYLDKIHTRRDVVLDENNITLLRENLLAIVQAEI